MKLLHRLDAARTQTHVHTRIRRDGCMFGRALSQNSGYSCRARRSLPLDEPLQAQWRQHALVERGTRLEVAHRVET